MTCEQVIDLLPDHALGMLPEADEGAVRRHLRACGPCRNEAAALDAGVSMLANATHVLDPPPNLERRVLAALDQEWGEAPGPARVRAPRRLRGLLVAAAAVLLVGAVTWAAGLRLSTAVTREDAGSYQAVLEVMGGLELRAEGLRSAVEGLQGTLIVYDSHRGQSWVGVHVDTTGIAGPIAVTVIPSTGPAFELPFLMELDDQGLGAVWWDTTRDLRGPLEVRLTGPDGGTLAEGQVPVGEA